MKHDAGVDLFNVGALTPPLFDLESSPQHLKSRDDLEVEVVADLSRLGYWQSNQTINLQSVGCGARWSGQLRVSWGGAILGYFGQTGWEREPP